ncbi:MAG: hypothetical protein ACPLF9_08325, partial [Methanothermobacter tenebrarum]
MTYLNISERIIRPGGSSREYFAIIRQVCNLGYRAVNGNKPENKNWIFHTFTSGQKKLDRLVYIMREPGATTGITYTIYSGYMNYSPLEFSVSYNLWERKKISLSLGVGTGIYRATISRHIYMDIYTSNETGSKRSPIRRILESGRPYLPALGGFGNVSVEYAVSSRLSFIAEAKARYGKISNFKGSEFSLYIDDNGNIGYNEYKGKLWFYPTNIDYWIGTSYSQLEISPVKPDMVWLSESILENIRKANLNLT